jgi:SAM-dependent methyltransferase
MLRKFVQLNQRLSRRFDNLLPSSYRVDGNRFFRDQFVPPYLSEGLTVYDVGGGKQPYISSDVKEFYSLKVNGLDIEKGELDLAPNGLYDKKICSDISQYVGCGDGDLVICQAVLEHVRDVDAAFAAITSILRSGGTALIFVPSRNAVFARLNLMLPQGLKKKVLHTVYPETMHGQGFPSYYHLCKPSQFRKLADKHALQIHDASYHYVSSYFSFFPPLYFFWRLWILVFRFVKGEEAAETFSMALQKK